MARIGNIKVSSVMNRDLIDQCFKKMGFDYTQISIDRRLKMNTYSGTCDQFDDVNGINPKLLMSFPYYVVTVETSNLDGIIVSCKAKRENYDHLDTNAG